MNILVTSAGGPAAIGVIKSLKDMNFDGEIIAIDSDELSVGLHLADVKHIVPSIDSDNFQREFFKIIQISDVDIILPTGPDINKISEMKETLSLLNANVFMSDYETIKLCNDKWEFHKKCKDKFPLPITSLNWEGRIFPLFAKPRIEVGGSRGTQICTEYPEAKMLDDKYEYIYQENLPGQEYTIDVLCDMESNPLVVVPRKRLQTKAGISSKGEIIRDNFIESSCFDMCKFLKLKGPVCLQMKEDKDGIPKFVEVNPRFGGGTYFTTLAGINFCKLIIDMINGKELNIPEPKPIKVLRYFEEIVI